MEEEEGSSFLFFGARVWARGTGSWERAWRRVGTATGMDAIFVRLQIWFLFSRFISHVVNGGRRRQRFPWLPCLLCRRSRCYSPTPAAVNTSRVIVVKERELFMLYAYIVHFW